MPGIVFGRRFFSDVFPGAEVEDFFEEGSEIVDVSDGIVVREFDFVDADIFEALDFVGNFGEGKVCEGEGERGFEVVISFEFRDITENELGGTFGDLIVDDGGSVVLGAFSGREVIVLVEFGDFFGEDAVIFAERMFDMDVFEEFSAGE